MESTVIAEGKNIRLRLPLAADIPMMKAWEESPDILMVSEDENPSHAQWEAFVLDCHRSLDESGALRVIIQLADGKDIGTVEVFEYMDVLKTAGLGIMIADKDERNKGYARQALELFIDYLRSEYAMESLFCNIAESNPGSVALFEKVGFVTAGLYPWRNRRGVEENVYHLQMNWI
jgi:diamine N-acetyltransferase